MSSQLGRLNRRGVESTDTQNIPPERTAERTPARDLNVRTLVKTYASTCWSQQKSRQSQKNEKEKRNEKLRNSDFPPMICSVVLRLPGLAVNFEHVWEHWKFLKRNLWHKTIKSQIVGEGTLAQNDCFNSPDLTVKPFCCWTFVT